MGDLRKDNELPPSLDDLGSVESDSDMSDGADSANLNQNGGSSTSGGTSNKSEEASSDERLAKKETLAVFRLRLAVFVVLLLAAVAVSVIVYFIAATAESDEYKAQFEGAAKIIERTFIDIVESRLSAVSSLGVAIVAHGKYPNSFTRR